jgi:hypothetical protein
MLNSPSPRGPWHVCIMPWPKPPPHHSNAHIVCGLATRTSTPIDTTWHCKQLNATRCTFKFGVHAAHTPPPPAPSTHPHPTQHTG